MKQGGFTLVELLIVIGIMGILVAVAVPVYLNYTVRARVTEGFSLVSGAQMAVADSIALYNGLPPNQAATSYLSPAPTENVESITIADDGSGSIIIDYTEQAGSGTIIFVPTLDATNNISWSCTGGTMEDRYRPVNCR